MEHSHPHPDNSSISATLTLRTARKRTRSQRQQRRRQYCRREHEGQRIAMEGMGLSSDSSLGGYSNRPADAQEVAFAPRASDGQSRQCIQRQTIFVLAAAALLLCSPSVITYVNGSPSLHDSIHNSRTPSALFVSPISRYSLINKSQHPSMSTQRKTPQQRQKTLNLETWSNAVRQKSDLSESRFGVRKRVKSVLDKAKKRTGIENSSFTVKDNESNRINGDSYFFQSGRNIIAETASLGGLFDEGGSVDVELDYICKGGQAAKGYNDTSGSISTCRGKSPSSGEKYADLTGASIKNGAKVSPTSSSSTNVPSMAPVAFQQPEDNFVIRTKDNVKMNNDTARKPYTERTAFSGDVSAAFSLPREPLPFSLPTLDRDQSRRLKKGERIQFQDDMGRAGSGYVVWDVKAPESVVWDCLLDFKSYPQTITTVREVIMYTNTHLKEDYRAEKPLDFEDGTAAICKHGVPSVTRAQFQLSKFRLKIAAVHKYRPHPKGDYMIFTLDPASANAVLKYAKGVWYTQSNPDGKEGYTRVWLLCELRVSRLLPKWIVDYAAARAMPRATSWLKPQTEAAAMLWLKDSPER
mmetsp:Transcript_23698/g.38741  ORF Transcript_23698/g.38741 Transcript_23698/m.38741 type:complete len:581 (-) Transcript_23698:99-1841(-)|eukprot:CAMPEP_0201982108 /NCGR_PEP_ID=MMETSP0904-20121228/75652_1 /ASSEMBLY_ACC=CAM_ASM_000553 /TAXON_ID=420261 /ORGANISM="Thalassiosira antarctica, Strain CCMP982" /LENGTH=580 /DNA_ID=CAMNT_0048534823 /DNA_START=73 /DNA_END=1815 /DNA_ORIENTATION=-